MPQAVLVEAGRNSFASTKLTDSGDNQDFELPGVNFISKYEDENTSYKPVVRLNGVVAGGKAAPGSANDEVDLSKLIAYIEGVNYSDNDGEQPAIAADTVTITRGTSPNEYIINSVIADATGFSVIAGTASTAWDDSGRGGAGQAPYIPVDAIEVCQVWLNSETSALVSADEIKQVNGKHLESALSPSFAIVYARVENSALGNAGVKFISPLRKIHTGDVAPSVYMSGYEPIFTELAGISDLQMPALSASVTSTVYYDRAYGSVSETLNAGSLNVHVDAWTDPIFDLISNGFMWIKHYHDKYSTVFAAVQGRLDGTPPNPAEGENQMAVTITAEDKYVRVIA